LYNRIIEIWEKERTLTLCFFASDLHGYTDRYQKLFLSIRNEHPDAVFLGGDILPSASLLFGSLDFDHEDFINGYLIKKLSGLREKLGNKFPRIFVILGNDDGRFAEAGILDAAVRGIWEYVHNRRVRFGEYSVFGYSYVPPTPFLLKDWEKYDISRHVDPGCISPEEGIRSFPVLEGSLKYSTIKKDLEALVEGEDLGKAIFLFHAPPYKTKLDRAALDGKMVDHVPLDVNVGSIAVERFIRSRKPLLTLHGHVHEASRLSHSWQDRIGKTYMFSAAYDGPELALVRFDPKDLGGATRELI
jgi:Icc-related predicted phosphoesterase